MSTSEPEAINANLARVIEEAREAGIPALTGECTVTLKVIIEDMATPVHAVDEMIYQLLNNGMRSYAFVVQDSNTGETYVVHDGEIIQGEADGASD